MSVALNSQNPVSPCLTSLDRKHLSCLLFTLMLLIVSSSRAALADEDVLQQVGITADMVARLLQGKVVSHELLETGDKEMALSAAIYLDVAPVTVSDFIMRGDMAAIDPDIIAYAEITAYANIAAFKRFAFSAKQHREVDGFLDDDVSESFNLSANEIASLSGFVNQRLGGLCQT